MVSWTTLAQRQPLFIVINPYFGGKGQVRKVDTESILLNQNKTALMRLVQEFPSLPMLDCKISKCIPYVIFQISGSTNKIFLFLKCNRTSQPTNSTSTQNRRKSHPTEKWKGWFASSGKKLDFQLVIQGADHQPSYEKKLEGVFFSNKSLSSLPLSQFKWPLLSFVSQV